MSKLSKAEIRKDTVQSAVEVAADTVHDLSRIVTTAVKEVVGALGGLATELFELREQARIAAADVASSGEHELDD